ncbi:hypothetical protein KGP36_07785 [Patescibacteria group bacterium]|nr:hypothetical protein [Patescibacteria group bacterium]
MKTENIHNGEAVIPCRHLRYKGTAYCPDCGLERERIKPVSNDLTEEELDELDGIANAEGVELTCRAVAEIRRRRSENALKPGESVTFVSDGGRWNKVPKHEHEWKETDSHGNPEQGIEYTEYRCKCGALKSEKIAESSEK